ncbi:MAG: TldD/PmbA family protein [Candidatus Sabulitectum sp.]|nr:TldD/PmbA family protein [Candidatus Sabulitectum sp.]
MREAFMTGSEILVACEKVSTEAEVTGIKRCYKSLEFTPGSSIPGSGERTGWGLRMARNGKLGVSGEWGIIDPFRLVDKAIGSCRYGPAALFSFPEDSPESEVTMASGLSSLTHDEVHIYLNDVQTRIKEIHPLATLSARVQWGRDSFIIMNSCGLSGSYSKTTASSSFSVTLPSDAGLLQSGYSLNTTDSLPLMNDVFDMLMLPIHSDGLNPLSAAGRKNAVFSPDAFSLLLQAVRAGVSGKLLAEGASPLATMEGKQVLANLLTIRDLPRLSSGAASAPFDSEGIPTADKTLFEDGVFTGFLHDLGSAAECGVKSTGSSGRNLGEHSKPVCTNLLVDPAMEGSVNTLTETGSGILVTSILSAGGGNAASGSFTLDCGRVYLFRRGEIQGYCDGCVLSGNVYDALSKVTAVGSRQYRIGTNLLPFISLESISVR